jgi:hypothetical protein
MSVRWIPGARVATLLLCIGGSRAVADPPPAKPAAPAPLAPRWRRIETTTYEQREAEAKAAFETAKVAVLVMPFASSAADAPPHFAAAGEELCAFERPWRVVDRAIPRLPMHEAFLKHREEAKGDLTALVDWCLKNGLPDCAELEAARFLEGIEDFHDPRYQSMLLRWLPLRDERQSAWSLPLPLEGEWFVIEDRTFHHRRKAWAAYAWDVTKKVGGKTFVGQGTRVEDYFAFGQPVIAQADGVVVSVEDHAEDNVPGKIGPEEANSVVVDYGGGLVVDYAHLKKGSAAVKPKDRVTRGQTLGLVGNSGATAAPHLHTSVYDWGFLSLRGRWHGEKREGDAWVPFEGRDLESRATVRNPPAPASPR